VRLTASQAEGYTVIGVDRCATPAGCRCAYTLQCDIKELHQWAAPSDTTSAQQLKALLASIAGAGAAPAVHLLVCNAAVQRLGALSELTVADFEETLATNLTAPAMLTQARYAGPEGAAGGDTRAAVSKQRLEPLLTSDPFPPRPYPTTAAPARTLGRPRGCGERQQHTRQPDQTRIRSVRRASRKKAPPSLRCAR